MGSFYWFCVFQKNLIKNNSRNHILLNFFILLFASLFVVSVCLGLLWTIFSITFFAVHICWSLYLVNITKEIYLNTLNWYIYGPLPRVSVWGIGYIFNALSSSLKWCFNLQLQLVSSLKLRQRSEYLYRFFSGYMCVQIPKNMVEIFKAF